MEAPNVLLLDEPTNDLDVSTLAVLEDFLEDFPGCVVVVSHDRWFLDRTVDHLFVIGAGEVARFEGNYSAWLEARGESARVGLAVEKTAPPGASAILPGSVPAKESPARRSYKENRELAALERDLPAWESQRRTLEERLSLPGDVSYGELERLSEELAALVTRIHSAEERWLHLSERPE
jgi:ATP-binding cassette subfamily F protein uup